MKRPDPIDLLISALKDSNTAEFQRILAQPAKSTPFELCTREIKHDGTLLHLAATLGDIEAIRTILALGIDVNRKQTEGHVISGLAPLHCAVKGGQFATVKHILNEGAEVNIQESEGQTPLFCACMGSNPEIVNLLLDSGANVNLPDYKGQTPLQISILRAPRLITNILIQRGADIKVLDKDGQSPLHYASEWNDSDTVQLLISKGADVNLQDNEGKSSLHVTADQDVLDILIANGGDVNLRDRRGKPPVETQIDIEKEEYKKINAALSLHSDLMVKKAADPSGPSLLAKDIQQKYNRLAMSGSAEAGAAKVNMLAELQGRVQGVDLDEDEPRKPKYIASPLAGAGVLSELTSKTSKVSAEKHSEEKPDGK